MEAKCNKCSAEFSPADSAAVCPQCLKMLDLELRVFYMGHITLLTFALIIALTGVMFFLIAASGGGDPSAFNVGKKGNLSATPAGMLILSGAMIVGAMGLAVGASYVKKKWAKSEDEYIALTNKEPVNSVKKSYF